MSYAEIISTSRYLVISADLTSWLKIMGINVDLMVGSSYHDEALNGCTKDSKSSVMEPVLTTISGLSCSTEGTVNEFTRASLVPRSFIRSEENVRAEMPVRFFSTGPVLGPGIMISRYNGKALITLVPSRENSVVQGVARDVLNGSALLDLTLPHHRHHTLYLVKEDEVCG